MAVVVGTSDPAVAAKRVRSAIDEIGADFPLPGHGSTWARFDLLTTIGEQDLTVGRLVEAHADARAILAELDVGLLDTYPDGVWAVWAAEPPNARVTATAVSGDRGGWALTGRKAWCSGAGGSTHALVTAHADDGPRLFAVELNQLGVAPVDDPWPTPALAGTDTRSVDFHEAAAIAVGGPNSYVERPGFWHGSVGVAAVWHGGAMGVAQAMIRAGQRRPLGDLELAQVGALGRALTSSRAALVAAATEFDADPQDTNGRAMVVARSTRAVVEAAATSVVEIVGRALGAAPLALDGDHARRVADLQLYLRQSHGDRDLADLGRGLIDLGQLW